MSPQSSAANDRDARRKRAVRTALSVAGVAVLIYAAFLLSGVLAS